jgi:hypothetical protein
VDLDPRIGSPGALAPLAGDDQANVRRLRPEAGHGLLLEEPKRFAVRLVGVVRDEKDGALAVARRQRLDRGDVDDVRDEPQPGGRRQGRGTLHIRP